MTPRPLSGVERVWQVAHRLQPPFAFHWVVEGEGALPADEVRAAVDRVAAAMPSSRVRLAGWPWARRWVPDGPLPAVREVDGHAWDSRSEAGAPWLAAPLTHAGPVLDLLLVRGRPDRLVLRCLHSAVDGRGGQAFLDALFATLRGQAPAPGDGEPLSDLDLARSLAREHDRRAEAAVPRDALPGLPLGPDHAGPAWVRRRVEGTPQQVLPRVLLALARHARAHTPAGTVRIDVPVDLRRHRPQTRSVANLTGLLRVVVAPDATADTLARAIHAALDQGAHADFVLAGAGLRRLPLWLLSWLGRREIGRGRAIGTFGATGTVTNLGRIDPAAWSCPGFRAQRAFFVPPINPDLPVMIGLVGDPAGVEVCAIAPHGGDVAGVVEGLAAGLGAPLTPTPRSEDMTSQPR